MSATDFGALTIAQKRVWAAETWQAGRDESFWFANGYIGKSDSDMNSVIQRVTKLTETERGLECVMQLVQDLQGDGVVGDNELDGNEEAMINDAQVIRIDQLRHGTKSKGEMAEQATVIRFRAQSKEKLAFWLSDKMDELMFLTLSGRAYTLKTNGATRTGSQLPSLRFGADVAAPSTNRILFGGSATSEGSITSSDKMSWATIVRANTQAAEKRLRPIRSGGRSYYVMVLHPRQRRDLVLDPTYQTIMRTAEKPGGDNKLFTGAMATIDGTIIYQHNKVFNTSGLASASKWGAGGLIDGAQALYLGAQAGGIATIGNTFWRESDKTDYGNRPGIGSGRKIGMLKPQFKSIYDSNNREDFGTIAIKTAAAA
ncbi:N4-gp56 family major capsid protein [Mesorhizobium onobrychidis]|uniref:N4-gp56 family major capsid protein n=1 Tax=Mesorhizobium onobrychidis TaxID=2775404 RepID=A0ABY5QVL7_9HYPH|nr:N4-gp56 family major capsid protein [Mesorhizobium onobrychidis]UVC14709.1 N4-gp56 family major capsid protein [Mesorhizobium onobrychidis]